MLARELIKGTLKYLVLNLLRKEPRMYGYEITQVLDEQSGGTIRLTFAALYPVLHKLEAEGMVRTETVNVNNRIRKYYSLTESGKTETRMRMNELHDYLNIIKALIRD